MNIHDQADKTELSARLAQDLNAADSIDCPRNLRGPVQMSKGAFEQDKIVLGIIYDHEQGL